MRRHAPFYPWLICAAILIGVFGGFGLGAHMAFVMAFANSASPAFPAMVQVHGHLQLLGWTGLFIIAMSLYQLPRLMSSKPLHPRLSPLLLATIAGGLVLRSGAQLGIFFYEKDLLFRYLVAVGSLLESSGIFLFVFTITRITLHFVATPAAVAARGIKPFLIVSLFGWFFYALLNLGIGLSFIASPARLLDVSWNNLAVETYIHLLLLPTCFAFSIGTFPIFLRLRSPTWPVKYLAMLYMLGASLYLLSLYAAMLEPAKALPRPGMLGVIIRTGIVFWLVFEIDLLRLRAPWYRKFRDNDDRENRPPRRNAGDFGQFGNFEWLIYSAYGWLCLAVAAELLILLNVVRLPMSIVRHFYLLGFVTQLILGMAVRMVPGFLGKNRIAYPSLVRLSFVLITFATLGRTMPPIFSALNNTVMKTAYGMSGIAAMLALCCLGGNLFLTLAQKKRSLRPDQVSIEIE